MKTFTKALFISTLLTAGAANSTEPMKAEQINTIELQNVAQTYLAQNLSIISENHLQLDTGLLIAKTSKDEKANNNEFVAKAHLLAE